MRGLHSRYDYEVPGGAAFDYLSKRPDVDSKRIAIMGYSFGGYYSGRIAAFDKRYAAGISLSALHWDLAAWQTRIKEKNKSDPKAVAQSNFQFQWVVDAPTEDAAIEIARTFSLKDVARNISCPYLVTHGGNDRVVPVENAPKLFEAIGSTNKTLKIFTAEEGGAEHAHVDNSQVGIDYAADWLKENMAIVAMASVLMVVRDGGARDEPARRQRRAGRPGSCCRRCSAVPARRRRRSRGAPSRRASCSRSRTALSGG